MRLPNLFPKITSDKIPFIVGGMLVGVLSLWVMGKILAPWVKPVVKDACLNFLELKQDRSGLKDRVVDVEAIRVATGTMTQRIVTVGKLRANEEVMLKSEMAGRISEISFKEGEAVEKDTVLIEFEKDDLVAEVNLAEAEVTMQQANYERITKLRSQNIESVKKFDETKAALAIAEAKLEKAKAQLAKAIIKAPFSGNIGLIDVSTGAYVQAGQELVKIVDNSPIKIDFKVPEQNIHDVGTGQTAELKIDGFPDQIFTATVASVDASLDAVSHSLSLRATLPNEDGRLRAGMFAHVSLIIGEKGNTIMVPEAAVTRDGEREFVWVLRSGKAGRRRVITGTRENGKVEILQGLRPDELVVTAGQIKLGEGTSVNVTNLEAVEETLKEEEASQPVKEEAKQTPPAASNAPAASSEPVPSTPAPQTPPPSAEGTPTAEAQTTPPPSPAEGAPAAEVLASPSTEGTPVAEAQPPSPAQETPTAETQTPPPPAEGAVSKMLKSLKNLFSKNKE